MKEEWDSIMDDKVNALKDLPFQVKFMSMQILAWMWSAVFGNTLLKVYTHLVYLLWHMHCL